MAHKSNAIVVGLTGQFGAGCTTVGEYLKEEGFHYYSLSDIVKASAQKRLGPLKYQELSKKKDIRRELQDEGNKLREPDTQAIAKQVFDQIKSANHGNEDIVIDSIRNPKEVEFFNMMFPGFFLLALDVSSDVRWLRTKSNYEDDEEQFKQDDMRDKGDEEPVYGQHTEICVYLSDVVIDNEKAIGYRQDWDLFFYKIKQYIDLMKEPGFRGPTYKELYMHIAYAISLKSSCNKRQVGAVIVSAGVSETGAVLSPRHEVESYVLASGYNDVPIGEKVCSELGGRSNPRFCARDGYEEKALRTMRYCPMCGEKLNIPPGVVVPYKCPKCNKRLPKDCTPGKLLDLCRSVHAEEAAILQAAKLGSSSLNGAELYTTTFPCLLCCKSIINAGIQKIIYREPYPMDESVNMLRNCGIALEKYEGVNAWAFDKMFKVGVQ
ncbi:deaminase [Candidatus Bathyarchaeota archaeon]|nr:deaminase [Candidatus Bathyarchaeota archaeon]